MRTKEEMKQKQLEIMHTIEAEFEQERPEDHGTTHEQQQAIIDGCKAAEEMLATKFHVFVDACEAAAPAAETQTGPAAAPRLPIISDTNTETQGTPPAKRACPNPYEQEEEQDFRFDSIGSQQL